MQNFRTWIRESITFKFITISILVLLLLIPASMIKSLIREREYTRDEVVQEVNAKWANEQLLVGPVISIPYEFSFLQNGQEKTILRYAHFLPEELKIDGHLSPEIRYRSIYEVIVYSSQISYSGYFDQLDFSKWNINEENVLFEEATISFGISDMRGINQAIIFDINDRKLEASPGLTTTDVIHSGVSATIGKPNKAKTYFKFTIDINGSHDLSFVPVGKTTTVKLESDWKNPSFDGSFLPDNRVINDKGFTAEWQILELNRDYPQKWLDNKYDINGSRFGTKFLLGVDLYQKSERSAKYAIMFLALTFLVFIMSEITNKKRIHPIQYLLIGVALCVFYVLLISLSEQIGFDWAYLIASTAVISLITIYTSSILKSRKITAIVGSSLVVLYVFLYTILQLQEYALLMGSIGIFVVLAITMYFSRKIDWYGTLDK
jgi:inner membrane protein